MRSQPPREHVEDRLHHPEGREDPAVLLLGVGPAGLIAGPVLIEETPRPRSYIGQGHSRTVTVTRLPIPASTWWWARAIIS